MGMVRVKATAFGTTALTDGSIVHFDPSRKSAEDARYRGGKFSEADAKTLVDYGIGEVVGDAGDDEPDPLAVVLPNNDAAEERLADAAEGDDEHPQTSSLSTMATVAFPTNPLNATTGPDDGISAGDPDAPPAARRTTAARRTAKPRARKATGATIKTPTSPPPRTEPGTNNEAQRQSPTGAPDADA